MQDEFRHFVITRLGLGVYDEDRLNKVIDLFAAVTLPSIKSQTRQDFIWLIIIDQACPAASKSKIRALIEGYQNSHCVSIDLTKLINVRLACFDWVWDCCQSFILENHLIQHPEDYVVTSIIDADDAWNRETIATVDRSVVDRIPELMKRTLSRGTWLRHSVGLTITFADGYVWFVSPMKFWPLKNEFMSMSVFVAARFSSGISACSCRHTQWRKYSEILEFEVMSLPSKEPMWIYSRHDETVESWNSAQGMQMPKSLDDRWEKMFGINRSKVDRWLVDFPPTQQITKPFNSSAALQYDLVFRIAGWNRLIRTLGNVKNPPGGGLSTEELLHAQAQREMLIRELQAGPATA